MIKSTLSFHMGTSFNLMHDNRTIWVNADTEYEREHNWYYEGNTTLEFIHFLKVCTNHNTIIGVLVLSLAAAIKSPGTFLSQFGIMTRASN